MHDVILVAAGFVPGAIAAGYYALSHGAKLTALAAKVDTAVTTVQSAAAAIKKVA